MFLFGMVVDPYISTAVGILTDYIEDKLPIGILGLNDRLGN